MPRTAGVLMRSRVEENTETDRPPPERMLARVKAEREGADTPRRQGRIKDFSGYAVGVGKTHAVLPGARRLKEAVADVVAGYVEPYGRAAAESLLDGRERLT